MRVRDLSPQCNTDHDTIRDHELSDAQFKNCPPRPGMSEPAPCRHHWQTQVSPWQVPMPGAHATEQSTPQSPQCCGLSMSDGSQPFSELPSPSQLPQPSLHGKKQQPVPGSQNCLALLEAQAPLQQTPPPQRFDWQA